MWKHIASFAVFAIAVANADHEPDSLAEVERMLKDADTEVIYHPHPQPPSPPPSPAWQKFEAEYSAMQNESCKKVLAAEPQIPDADSSAFMAAYTARACL